MMSRADPSGAGMTRVCPVCAGTRFEPMFASRNGGERRTPGERYRITHSSRALVGAIERCAACGLGVLPPGLIGAAQYDDGADERFAEQSDVRIRNAQRLLELLPHPRPGTVLLDVGSAYGFLLAAAGRLGYRPIGVEPSIEAARYARATYGVEVFNGTVDAAPFEPGSFDVITLADVIEHLTDPGGAMKRLHHLLRRDGRLVILTPDLGSLAARAFGRHWWALLDDHYFYFCRRTLPRFLREHRFEVESLRSFGRAFPISHWVFKLSQYSSAAHGVLDKTIRAVGLADVEVPLNLGDQMVCIARRAGD
jgi:SAM-dependent methyltransferase